MTRTRPPSDGVCAVCARVVGVANLVWDHCHRCNTERGWACDDCNCALTQHLIDNWDAATRYIATHECTSAPLPGITTPTKLRTRRERQTERLYLGNGAGDPRYVMVSTRPGALTVEQFAVIMGVTAGTARDLIKGRRGKRGYTLGGTIFIDHGPALAHLKEKWNLP